MQTLEVLLKEALAPEQTDSSPLSWGWAAAQFSPAHAEVMLTAGEEAELLTARGVLGMLVEIEREKLANIDPEHLDNAVNSLALDEMPQTLREAVGGYDTDASTHSSSYLYQRLIARGPDDESYLISDETALNVMEWHDHRVRGKQAVFEASGVPDALRERFAHQVRNAPWMPAEAGSRLERLGRTTIFLDDGFSGAERQIHGGAVRRNNGAYQVFLQPSANDHTRTHEFVHVIEGPEVEEGVMTGLERVFGNMPGVKLLQEAITDQTASSLLNGHPEVTDMGSEFRRGMGYPAGALLLFALCQGGTHPIDAALFRGARFEEAGKPLEGSFADQLLRQLQRAFPEHNIPLEIGRLGSENREDDLLLSFDTFVLAAKLCGADTDEAIALLRQNGL